MSETTEITKQEHRLDNLMPVTVSDKLKLAEILCKSGLMPNTLNTPQKVFIALQMGHELGLSPMISVNNISAINGKPVISADLQVAVARRHPDFAGMSINDDGKKTTVVIKRNTNGATESFTASFSMDDAVRGGLATKDNWKRYPERMRKHRATSYALRDAFPDALAGTYTREEMEDDFDPLPQAQTGNGKAKTPQEAKNVTEQNPAQQETNGDYFTKIVKFVNQSDLPLDRKRDAMHRATLLNVSKDTAGLKTLYEELDGQPEPKNIADDHQGDPITQDAEVVEDNGLPPNGQIPFGDDEIY